MSDAPVLIGVLAAVGLLLAALRRWQRCTPPPPAEHVRKTAHMLVGLLAATFPWIFASDWPVITLCAASLTLMILLRAVPRLRDSLGRVTNAVNRPSWGELLFPIGIGAAWVISNGEARLYVIPMLFLALGDAAAALVGREHGFTRFRTTDGRKSVEGSLAFLIVGFASAMGALLALAPDIGPARGALIALLLGILLMAFEAVSWRGLDNLILPVMGVLLLRIYLEMPASDLIARLAAFALLFVAVIAFRRSTTLIGEGVLASALYLYCAWALGGWDWLAPGVAVLAGAATFPRSPLVQRSAMHGVFPVLALAGPSLAALILHVRAPEWGVGWTAYATGLSAALAIISVAQRHPDLDRWPAPKAWPWAVVMSPLLVCGAGLLLRRSEPAEILRTLPISASAATLAVLVSFHPAASRRVSAGPMWTVRAIACSLAVALGAGLDSLLPGAPQPP